MKTAPILVSVFLLIFFSNSLFAQKLNQTQVIGSHNSYKSEMPQEILDYLTKVNPGAAQSLAYAHVSIKEQLEMGLRNLELDVFHDPNGGYYTNPAGLSLLDSTINFDPNQDLSKPGLKLFHVQDLDFHSHHLLFRDALLELKAWSEANPSHHPIFVLINAKDGRVPGTKNPLEFNTAALDSIDLEIKLALGKEKLIIPDAIRGNFYSVEEGAKAGNWPSLESSRGKFLFVLDESEEKIKRYLAAKPSLKDAVLFVNLKEGNPEAAFRIINNPVSQETYIRELVNKGYLVRTRADSDTKQARTNDYSQFEKAKSSGAQIISTDYYLPSRFFPSSYVVHFEKGKFERKNPILRNTDHE